jgi:hypothetical protein
MSRKWMFLMFAGLCLLIAGSAFAQTGGTSDPGAATQVQQPPATTPPPAAPAMTNSDDPTNSIREKGSKLPEKEAKTVNARVETSEKSVDAAATKDGDQKVADRLAKEFGITSETLTQEKSQFNVGWGQLTIAHTLMANAKTPVTLQQLFDMRTSGMGWGQIAKGMGFKLGDVVSAVKSEASVAAGHSKPDGKVATIHGASASDSKTGQAMRGSHAHGAMGGDAAKVGGKGK